jgi:hypothetical protein
MNSDQLKIDAFNEAAGANSTNLATGMKYNSDLANTELAVKKAELDHKKNSENNASAEKIAQMGYDQQDDNNASAEKVAQMGYDQQDDNNASAERIAGVENPGTGNKSTVPPNKSEKNSSSAPKATTNPPATGNGSKGKSTSEKNNDILMDILKGNADFTRKGYNDVTGAADETKKYIMDGTAYTDKAAQTIRDSFASEGGSGENTYGANQKNRTGDAYGAAAENAVLARAMQTESNLNASDRQLLEAFKAASGANSTDLATGMQYNNDLANTEADGKIAELDYQKNADNNASAEIIAQMGYDQQDDNNASAERVAQMGHDQQDDNNASAERIAEAKKAEEEKTVVGTGGGNDEGPTTGELLFAYYNYLSENGGDPEEIAEMMIEELELGDESAQSLKDAIQGDSELYKDNSGVFGSMENFIKKGRRIMKPQDFYVALASGDTDKTLGKASYEEYVKAYKNLNNVWE